jgi:transformer-2 protein
MAPSNAPISIPTGDVTMTNGAADSQAWEGGRSPGRGGGGDLPRRSSRSRSPVRGNGDDRKYVSTQSPLTSLIFLMTPTSREGGQNPGNNLHISSLSSRVDTRDLEAAFAKIGRVSGSLCRACDLISTYGNPG